jgi:hypothetical protein
MSGHASARFGFGLDNSLATSFGHLGPTPQSRSVTRKLGDAYDAFVAAAKRSRSNLSILIYCIPADIQPSHSGLLYIDEVRKERGHGKSQAASNSQHIDTIRQCFRHACPASRTSSLQARIVFKFSPLTIYIFLILSWPSGRSRDRTPRTHGLEPDGAWLASAECRERAKQKIAEADLRPCHEGYRSATGGANGATSPPSNSNLQSGGGPGGLTTSPHHVPENGGAPKALPAPRARPYREPLFLLALAMGSSGDHFCLSLAVAHALGIVMFHPPIGLLPRLFCLSAFVARDSPSHFGLFIGLLPMMGAVYVPFKCWVI